VISLLNAFTGLAVAASGFTLNNFALIVAGTLVGASGSLLTKMMSDAMGRSLANVLFGAFGQVRAGAAAVAGQEGRSVRSASAEDLGTLLAYSQRVIIVPGYGLAVAQAQHAVRELAELLEKRGVEVSYAIHPVAGRMPGHMNVLLAEANVPYEQLKEMDEINDEFKNADVVLIVGANDLRHADLERGPGQDHSVHEEVDASGVRRHRQRAHVRPQDDDVLRRRQGVADQAGKRSKSGLIKQEPKGRQQAGFTPAVTYAATKPSTHGVTSVGVPRGRPASPAPL
jgi:hypothetical protein